MSENSAAGPSTVRTDDGIDLEALWTMAPDPWGVVVVTHPHPQMGGDMHNPVPAGVARLLAESGLTAVRVNFHGTGRSTGSHGEGRAEIADVVAAIDVAARQHGDLPVFGVGYSFGADVLLAVDDPRLVAVVAVAPPLRVLPADLLAAPRPGRPTLLLSPDHDQFCDPDTAQSISADWPNTAVEGVAGTDHFMIGAVERATTRARDFFETHRSSAGTA